MQWGTDAGAGLSVDLHTECEILCRYKRTGGETICFCVVPLINWAEARAWLDDRWRWRRWRWCRCSGDCICEAVIGRIRCCGCESWLEGGVRCNQVLVGTQDCRNSHNKQAACEGDVTLLWFSSDGKRITAVWSERGSRHSRCTGKFVYRDDTLEFIQTAVNAARSQKHAAQSVQSFWTRNKWVWKLKSWFSDGKYQVLHDQRCEAKWACPILVVINVATCDEPAPAESDTNKMNSLMSMKCLHSAWSCPAVTQWSCTLDRLPQSFALWHVSAGPKPKPLMWKHTGTHQHQFSPAAQLNMRRNVQ